MPKLLAAVILLLASAVAYGGEKPLYKPFQEAQISEAQWDWYHRMVVDAYGASLRQFPDEHLEVLHSTDQAMHFAFTTSGHPAHPAWITRSAKDGSVDQIGYFAGEEQPFAELFQAYRALTDRTLESIPDEPIQP
jgi:hypothetical protein